MTDSGPGRADGAGSRERCPECGSPVRAVDETCWNCGSKVTEGASTATGTETDQQSSPDGGARADPAGRPQEMRLGPLEYDDQPAERSSGQRVVDIFAVLAVVVTGAYLVSTRDVTLFGIGFLLVCLLLFVGVFPPARQRLLNARPTPYGMQRLVERTTVADTGRRCDACGSLVDSGERHTYSDDLVAGRIPLFTTDSDDRYYCDACLAAAHEETGDRPRDDEDEPGVH